MSDLAPGARVTHPLFGAGTVRNVAGSGPNAKITVDFSPSIGQKKLIASAANLQCLDRVDEFGERTPAPVAPSAWVECLDVEMVLKSGRRPPRDRIVQAIQDGVRQEEFWLAVRERLRHHGRSPRVMDDISGNVSIVLERMLSVKIRVRHRELLRPDDQVLARAAFDLIAERYLIDFERFAFKPAFGIQFSLMDEGIVEFNEAAPPAEELPDRSPRQRPKPVTPKGVIKSRPKRRDDY